MDYQYQIGTVNDGTNALGGVDFAYAGMDAGGCVSDEEAFIIATGDALRGVDCTVAVSYTHLTLPTKRIV